MKKMSAVAACGLSALVVGAAAPSQAAPVTVGNLVHSPVKYVCTKGMPNFLLAVKAVNTPEATVSASATTGFGAAKVGPVSKTQAAYFFATKNLAGTSFMLNVKGNTSGSMFSVNISIPKSCAGLPGSATAPAKPANPTMPAKRLPVRPMHHVMPVAPVHRVMPMKPVMPVKPVRPVVPMKPAAGPKVQTDYVASNNGVSTSELALGAFGLTAAAAGSLLVARRSSRD